MFAFRSSRKIKKNKIDLVFKEDIEPHEIMLDSLAKQEEKELGFSEKRFEVPILRKIVHGFFVFCVLVIAFLLFKTFQLQILSGKEFANLAERNKFIIHKIQAERGVIYDQNMEQLVFNKFTFDLVCGEEIVRNLSHEELILFESGAEEYSGCEVVTNAVREYKDSTTFAHLIGYTAKINNQELTVASEYYTVDDYVGRAGLESYYERYLRKNPGKLRIERDAFGERLSEETIALPESGNSLVLWLDAELQRKAESALREKYEEIGAKGAVFIAMDPKTGGVLSLVSLPSFDNNLFQKGADANLLQELLEGSKKTNALFNRAIAGKYLVGSTIKPIIATAALEEKIIDPKKQIYSSGVIEVPHRYDPSITYYFKDWTAHGWVDMRKALAQSSNVYFYAIGGGYGDQKGLGPTKIKEYLELFGWNSKTNIDLPNEAVGFIPDPDWKKKTLGESWLDGNTYYLSIGQEYLQITPLEVITSLAAIANGGKLLEPKVVKAVIDKDKNVVEEMAPTVVRENFVDLDNLQVVKEGMRRSVSGEDAPRASAALLNSLPVNAAAKTGTAELGQERYNSWATVFAPYEDPEIIITVVFEDVKGIRSAVLPVAQEVLNWYFTER